MVENERDWGTRFYGRRCGWSKDEDTLNTPVLLSVLNDFHFMLAAQVFCRMLVTFSFPMAGDGLRIVTPG